MRALGPFLLIVDVYRGKNFQTYQEEEFGVDKKE